MPDIWIWQRIVGAHTGGLAAELARAGHAVTFVAEQAMSDERRALGWQVPDLGSVRVKIAGDAAAVAALVARADARSIHLCQGVRGNGLVGFAQRELARRGLAQWVVMETVDDPGFRGAVKRALYRGILAARADRMQGILAIGHRTPAWLAARGVSPAHVYPFAYFLADAEPAPPSYPAPTRGFRVLYVGGLVALKRVDWLITALAAVADDDCELTIVGCGPEEAALRRLAERHLPGRVRWLGLQCAADVVRSMRDADCLVLPSRHDGWGAVVSESLMAGTPVLCSDACGSAGVVAASGSGGVFRRDDFAGLVHALAAQVHAGAPADAQRRRLAGWARCLGAGAGAAYLGRILAHHRDGAPRPLPPWHDGDGVPSMTWPGAAPCAGSVPCEVLA